MGGTLSRIFHRKQDDESKPKVKKPRRFGSLRRQRTEDQETGTRVSRSSTMPSRTQHVRTEDRSTALIGETAEEAQRLEDRREIMRDVMDSDETVTPVAAQHLSAQMPHVEPIHVPEHKEVVPEIKAELPGGFAAVQLVSATPNDKAVEDLPELRQTTEALHEEDEPVILNVEDLRQLTQEHEEHIGHTEQKVSREQNIEPIMEPEKCAEEINEPIKNVIADSAGLARSEQHIEHKQEEVFTQEVSEHVKETDDYFHAEGTELEGQPQSAEFLHSETAYVQADEVPIRYDVTENVQGYAPTMVFETVENSFAEKEENHVHLKDAHHNEELVGSSKEEDADYRLITRETATGQDFERVSENTFSYDQAESSEEHDKALREDQNESSDVVEEIQYLQEVKQFEKREQEDEILQVDLVKDDELAEKFPVEHMEHVDISQEISGVQNSEHPFEPTHLPLGDMAHAEDGTKELTTEGAKVENISQVLDVQYFQRPLENETRDRLVQEFTEHIEEPLEQLSSKDAEPEGIPQALSDFHYFQQPPENETKDHLLHDYNEHTEGSAEHLPVRDAELENMSQEVIDAEHFQRSLEHEVRDHGLDDHDEHTEGSVEHVPPQDAEVEGMSQEVLDAEHFQQPLEHETRDHLLQEFTEHIEEPVEQLSSKDAEPEDMPQEVLVAEHFQQPLEHEVRDHGLDDHDEHTEESVERVPPQDTKFEDMPQEVLDAEHFQRALEHEVQDHGLDDHDEHTEESVEHVPPQDAKLEDMPPEVLDAEYSQEPPELKTNHLQEYTGQPAEEFPADFARFSDVPQVASDTQHSGQTNGEEGIHTVPQKVGDDEGTLDNLKRTDVFQETLEIQHPEQPREYDDGDLTQKQDTDHVEKFPQGSSNQDVEQADTNPEKLDIQYSEIPGQHTPAEDVLHSDVERHTVEDDYIPRETLDIQHSEQVLEQEGKDISKVEDINKEILDEPTDYGIIGNNQQPEVEGEQQMQKSGGQFESGPMKDSVHQYSQEEHELEPEHSEHALEHAGKPYFENADHNEGTDNVTREPVFEQDDAHLDAESVAPQVGECQSHQTEHTKLDSELSEMYQTGNNAHEDITSTEENTNGLQPDQAEWAETHESGSTEPMPDNGSINGLNVGHSQLKQNVPEVDESNGDFDHSVKLPNTRLADQQDFDSDISRSPKSTAACDPPHDEDQQSNGLPVSGAENLS